MNDDLITVNVTREGRKWVADVVGYGKVDARNLLELVGVAHNLVLLTDNRPRALHFVYPYAAEREKIRDLTAKVDEASRRLYEAKKTLMDKIASEDSSLSAADVTRLLEAP